MAIPTSRRPSSRRRSAGTCRRASRSSSSTERLHQATPRPRWRRRSDLLVLAQRAVWLAVVLAVVLTAATILVAPRRLRATLVLALGAAGALVLVRSAVREVVSQAGDLARTPGAKAATNAIVGGAGTWLMRLAGLLLLVMLLVVAAVVLYRRRWRDDLVLVAAVLVGVTHRRVARRQRVGPRHRPRDRRGHPVRRPRGHSPPGPGDRQQRNRPLHPRHRRRRRLRSPCRDRAGRPPRPFGGPPVLISASCCSDLVVGAAAQWVLGRDGRGIDWGMALIAGLAGSLRRWPARQPASPATASTFAPAG